MDSKTMQTTKETRSAIITLHSHGLTIPEVAHRLGISSQTARNWIRRYQSTASIRDYPRVGRPRRTTSQQDMIISEAIKADPLISAIQIKRQHQLPCSLQTIRNRMQTLQKGRHTPAEPPIYEPPPKDSVKRKFSSDTKAGSSLNSSFSCCGEETQQKKHMTALPNSLISRGGDENTCMQEEPISQAKAEWVGVVVKHEEEEEIKVEVKEEALEEVEDQAIMPITTQGSSRSSLGSGWAEDTTTGQLHNPPDRGLEPSPLSTSEANPLEVKMSASIDSNRHVLGTTSQQGAAVCGSHPAVMGCTSLPVVLCDKKDTSSPVTYLVLSDSEESKELEEVPSEGDEVYLSRATLLDSDSSCINSGDESMGKDDYVPPPEEIKEVPWKWVVGSFTPNIFPFDSQSCGVAADIGLTENSSELDCFIYLFDIPLMGLITRQTNKHHKSVTKQASEFVDEWRDVTINELYVFLGFCLLMPHIGIGNRREFWVSVRNMLLPNLSKTMTESRYQMIAKFLRFVSSSEPTKDPLAKIRPVYSRLQKKFRGAFIPFRNVMIDESQIMFTNRLTSKQSIPSKNHEYEVKTYVLCDCKTGFVLDFLIYSSAATEGAKQDYHGTAGAIVKRLLEPWYGKGHTLFVGSWCSSPQLFHYLLTKEVGACGMVKPNQKFCPQFSCVLKGNCIRYHANNVLAMKWYDQKPNHILSTVHGGETAHLNKAKPVVDYKNNTRRIAISDVQTNSKEIRVVKWYKKLFYHLLDLAVVNAYILFVMKTGTKPKYRTFHQQLIMQILETFGDKATNPNGEISEAANHLGIPLRFMLSRGHFLRLLSDRENEETQKECHVCLNTTCQTRKHKRTSYYCSVCNVPLCVIPCFERYHTVKNF